MATTYTVETPDGEYLGNTSRRSSAVSAARVDGFQHGRDTRVIERRDGRPPRRLWSYGREGRGRRPRSG